MNDKPSMDKLMRVLFNKKSTLILDEKPQIVEVRSREEPMASVVIEKEKIKEVFLFRIVTPEMEMTLEKFLSKQEKDLLLKASLRANKGFELIHKNPNEAIRLLLEAVDLFDQAGGYETEVNGDILNDIGLAYSWVNMYEEALHYFNLALKRFENKDWDRYVSVLINRASLYEASGDWTKAIEELNNAHQIAKNNNLSREQILILNNIAYILYCNQIFDHSLEKYKQVLSNKLSLNYHRLSIAQTHFNIANIYEDLHQIREAIYAYKNCLEQLEFEFKDKEPGEVILQVMNVDSIRSLQRLIREHTYILERRIEVED